MGAAGQGRPEVRADRGGGGGGGNLRPPGVSHPSHQCLSSFSVFL